MRGAIVTALEGIVGGPAVTTGRVYPDAVTDLPGLNVVTGDESVLEEERVTNTATGGKWLQQRACNFDIECRATAAADVDDALDALALSVEQALGADVKLGGVCDKLEYAGSEGELSGDLEKPIGLRTLNYAALYRVDARDPQALED